MTWQTHTKNAGCWPGWLGLMMSCVCLSLTSLSRFRWRYLCILRYSAYSSCLCCLSETTWAMVLSYVDLEIPPTAWSKIINISTTVMLLHGVHICRNIYARGTENLQDQCLSVAACRRGFSAQPSAGPSWDWDSSVAHSLSAALTYCQNELLRSLMTLGIE